jgi:spermidine/putrescine transport system permease protein
MRNKHTWFAVPYVVWMALFVVAPIIMVVIYAFSSADGGFTLSNFTGWAPIRWCSPRSFSWP